MLTPDETRLAAHAYALRHDEEPGRDLWFASLSGLYVLLSDRLQYHNNRYVLLLMCLLLALTPCDRSFCIRGNVRDPAARRGPIWAQRLMQLQLSIVYAASIFIGSRVRWIIPADWLRRSAGASSENWSALMSFSRSSGKFRSTATAMSSRPNFRESG